MTVGVVIGRSPRAGRLLGISRSGAPRLLDRIKEILGIHSRGLDAAHAHEELKPLSDEALADRGLTREEVPRAAFRKLTDGL